MLSSASPCDSLCSKSSPLCTYYGSLLAIVVYYPSLLLAVSMQDLQRRQRHELPKMMRLPSHSIMEDFAFLLPAVTL